MSWAYETLIKKTIHNKEIHIFFIHHWKYYRVYHTIFEEKTTLKMRVVKKYFPSLKKYIWYIFIYLYPHLMTIFSDIVQKKSPAWIVYQDELVTAFFDYFPASMWHLLIVPNEIYENIFDIPENTLSHLAKVSKKIALVYRDILGVKDMNFIQSNWKIAGQEVFHYHMHLIPRYENDTVSFSWKHHEDLRERYNDLQKKIQEQLI